jgi:DNA-binding winged helix-turn-helix (wHTH) protein
MIYGFTGYTLDDSSQELYRAGREVALEPKMFQVLLYLLQHRDRIVTKDELLEACWPGTFVSEAALTRCIAKLRQAVQPDRPEAPVIQTVHGRGYRFVAKVTTSEAILQLAPTTATLSHPPRGEAAAVAARLAALAAPDTVLISAATARLVEGYFMWQTLGERHIPEVKSPLAMHRVLHESGARTRLEVAVTRGLTPLVGREQDVRLLVERWENVQAGDVQVVLLSGEAGIGKSRVVEALKEYAAHTAYTPIIFRCSPYHQHSVFYPAIAHLRQVLRLHRNDPRTVYS